MKKVTLTAIQYPSGEVKYIDLNTGKEYLQVKTNGMGYIEPISATAKGYSSSITLPSASVSLPSNFTTTATATKKGWLANALDKINGALKNDDGTNTFIGDLAKDLIEGKAKPIGQGEVIVGNPGINPTTGQYYTPSFTPKPANNMLPLIIGGSVLALGLVYVIAKK